MKQIITILKKITEKIQRNFYLRNITLAIAIAIGLIIFLLIFLRIYTHHNKAYSVPDLQGFSVEEADKILNDRNLKYKVIDSVYVTDFERGMIVDQIPKAEFKIKKDRTIFLTINAHTPEKVVMPNVVGFSYRQAVAVLNTTGLYIGRLIYVPDIAKNRVLKQKIAGRMVYEGDTLIKGTKIDLEIGNGLSNEKVIVPNLIDLPLYKAKDKLNTAYLNLGAPIYDICVQTYEDTISARIYRQRPEAGNNKRLPIGSFVDVWLTTDSTKFPGYDSLMTSVLNKENNLYDN